MSKRKKLFIDYFQKEQDKIVKEQLTKELNDEEIFVENTIAVDDIQENDDISGDINLGNTPMDIDNKCDNEARNNPLFGNIYDNEEVTETGDIEEYLKIMYQKFSDSFYLNEDDQQLFEEQEYSYSDSDSSSDEEEGIDLYNEIKDIGKRMDRDVLNDLLKVLRKVGHEELPATAKTLLNTPKTTKISPCDEGEYFHYGLKQSLIDIADRGISLPPEIEIDIGIDGLPLSKSGKKKFWPILGKIVNMEDLAPFLIGCYHGSTNPTSASSLLLEFIEEFKKLQKKQLKINNISYKIKLRCVICDTPARCMVTATQYYNGYYGCCKCQVKGKWLRKTVFVSRDATLRTNESFRNRDQKEHHTGKSPFEDLDIDMVKQFPLDYMHLIW